MGVCFFDIDGTLINTRGAGMAALESALRDEFDIHQGWKEVPKLGRTDRGIIRHMFATAGVEDSEDNWDRLVAAYVARLQRELPSRSGVVLPGVLELLAELPRRGFEIGLLTGNVRQGAEHKLQHFGIWDAFAFGGYGDEHSDRDSVAHAARAAAAEHLDRTIASEEIWVLGDTPLDVSCARAIGARAIAVATGFAPRKELEASQPDLLVDTFADLAPLLDVLGA
jgi:phosphoglycolate phosphatase-like HAD superfamily hydrolase